MSEICDVRKAKDVGSDNVCWAFTNIFLVPQHSPPSTSSPPVFPVSSGRGCCPSWSTSTVSVSISLRRSLPSFTPPPPTTSTTRATPRQRMRSTRPWSSRYEISRGLCSCIFLKYYTDKGNKNGNRRAIYLVLLTCTNTHDVNVEDSRAMNVIHVLFRAFIHAFISIER